MIFVIAFVVGFSERLAKNFIGKAEEIAGGNRDNPGSKPVTNELSTDIDSLNMLPNQLAISGLTNSVVASNLLTNQLDSSDSLNGKDDLEPRKID
ncbi:MAG: hypothetical protein V7K88_15455 [Nostoc sp.]|uniref:hypothetical protein n=1 Tax=Nostoc sp. TaxID=1180 RepID=UPI002FFA4F1A